MAVAMLAAVTESLVYAENKVDYSTQLAKLEELMSQCEAKGIPTDYER